MPRSTKNSQRSAGKPEINSTAITRRREETQLETQIKNNQELLKEAKEELKEAEKKLKEAEKKLEEAEKKLGEAEKKLKEALELEKNAKEPNEIKYAEAILEIAKKNFEKAQEEV